MLSLASPSCGPWGLALRHHKPVGAKPWLHEHGNAGGYPRSPSWPLNSLGNHGGRHLPLCPHLPGAGCLCRKPQTGLLQQAARNFGVNPRETFVIGDQSSDIEMGRSAGATTFLVLTAYGATTLEQGSIAPDYVVADVLGAAQVIQRLLSSTEEATLSSRQLRQRFATV